MTSTSNSCMLAGIIALTGFLMFAVGITATGSASARVMSCRTTFEALPERPSPRSPFGS